MYRDELADLVGGRAEGRDRPRVPQDVLDLRRGERGVNGDVRAPGAQASEVGQHPLGPGLRHDRHPVLRPDPELPQTERDGPHARFRLAMRDGRPHAAHLGPKGGRTSGVALDRLEEQSRQRSRAHGCTTTTKLTGEPRTGPGANTVSAAASTRTVSRLLRSPPTRAWRCPVPGRSAAVTPVVVSTTSRKAAVSTVAQAIAADTASPRPSRARAWGRRVSSSSTLTGAATSIATTWLKSGPSFPHAAAAARASASAPAPRGPHRVTAPPPIPPRETRRTNRGRAGPGWRARSTFARRAPWADAPGTPAGAGRRRRDRRASAAGRRARSGPPPARCRAPGPAGSAGSPRRGAASS